MVIKNTPLVSITVGTYNSSKYVLETLESIKAQTYQNIELIVSDDCSTDNTVQLCKDWVSRNEGRFVRAIVLESPINTGVSGNGNRARRACKGEWVKGIAGDDLLTPDCVMSFIDYAVSTSSYFVFCRIDTFGGDEDTVRIYNNQVFDYSFFEHEASEQNRILIIEGNHIPAPGFFYNLSLLNAIGVYNDEEIPMMEDWPKWINITNAGYKLSFIDRSLVKYRLSDSSVSRGLPSLRYYETKRNFFFKYRFPFLMKKDYSEAIAAIIEEETNLYSDILKYKQLYDKARTSYSHRIGSIITYPLRALKQLFSGNNG